MGFFDSFMQTLSTGISDEDSARMRERDRESLKLAQKEATFVMGQVGFYAAIAGVAVVAIIIAYKRA